MKKTGKKKEKKYEENEVKRYMGALSENFQHKVSLIAEQYTDIKEDMTEIKGEIVEIKGDIVEMKNTLNSHTETLNSHTETLNSHTQMIGKLMEDMEIVKSDVHFLKEGLKKKIDDQEFYSLERRVALLEKKAVRS